MSKTYGDRYSRNEENNYVKYRFLLTLEAMINMGHKTGYLGYVQWMNDPMTWYMGGGALTMEDIERTAAELIKKGGRP